MIKAVVFDYGGVITDGGAGNHISDKLAGLLRIDPETAHAYFQKPWAELVRGTIDEPTFWHKLEKAHGQPISETQRLIWNSWDVMQPRSEMIAFIQMLYASGYKVGLLSNTIPFTANVIREHGGYNLFDPCILSFEVGYAKPDKEIYWLLLRSLSDIAPEQIVYVDDQSWCLIPAQAMGMKTVHAISTPQIIDDITDLLTDA